MDYSMDEQWNLWVKQGVRKMVLKEDDSFWIANHKPNVMETSWPDAGSEFGPVQVPPPEYQLLPRISTLKHTPLVPLEDMDLDYNQEPQSEGNIELEWNSNFDDPSLFNTTVGCLHM
jgi:hypothetical protein